MRLGWGHDDGAFFFSRPDAAQQECCEPGVHSTLHGVVFAIFCPGPAVHRRSDAMPGPGHEIVSASRLRDESIQFQHIMLQTGGRTWIANTGTFRDLGDTPRCTVSASSPLSWRGFSSELRFTTGPTGSNGVSELRRMAIEIVLRELGGFIWIQITVLII